MLKITDKLSCTEYKRNICSHNLYSTYYRCRDYVHIDRGSYGITETCDKEELTDKTKKLDTDGSFTVIFRTGECNNDGKKWVHYKEDGCNQYHQCEDKDAEDVNCSCYYTGFEMYAICFNESKTTA